MSTYSFLDFSRLYRWPRGAFDLGYGSGNAEGRNRSDAEAKHHDRGADGSR